MSKVNDLTRSIGQNMWFLWGDLISFKLHLSEAVKLKGKERWQVEGRREDGHGVKDTHATTMIALIDDCIDEKWLDKSATFRLAAASSATAEAADNFSYWLFSSITFLTFA